MFGPEGSAGRGRRALDSERPAILRVAVGAFDRNPDPVLRG